MKAKHLLRGGSAVALALAAGFAGCVDTDNRPKTLEYITETILKPSCGTVNCHSSLGYTKDYAFDSVAAARATFNRGGTSPGAVLTVMRREYNPMPPNDIVADQDLELIQAWIDAGTPGL
jgi:hypothetical protein